MPLRQRVKRDQPTLGVGNVKGPAESGDKHESPQRARKRVLDREAQRNFRKRTKDYIAQLEAKVETFQAENQTELVQRLVSQNATLRAENEQQAKLLSDLASMIKNGLSGSSIASPDSPMIDSGNGGSEGGNDLNLPAINAGLRQGSLHVDASDENMELPVLEVETSDALPEGQVQDLVPFVSHDSETMSLDDVLFLQSSQNGTPDAVYDCSWMNTGSQHSIQLGQASCSSVPRLLQLPRGSNLRPPGMTWQATCKVFGRVFQVGQRQALQARHVEEGVIFQGIKEGWDNLSTRQQSNPVIQIIREYDERFPVGSLINRLALAYKNHLLVKYFLNLDPRDMERMPEWFRPWWTCDPSRRPRKEDVALALFAWPALRERFVTGQSDVYVTEEFGVEYLKNFRFEWPFAFEDTFKKDPVTGEYSPTALFKLYHADLRFWRMNPQFFKLYPELARDMNSADALEIEAMSPGVRKMNDNDELHLLRDVYKGMGSLENPELFPSSLISDFANFMGAGAES